MLFRFTLTYNAVDTIVPEPKNWKDFKSEIKRDFKSHGVVFNYTSGSLKLGFAGAGRDILESAFRLEGFDAEVTFKAQGRETEYDSYSTLFEGTAVMENRELNQDFFEVDFEVDTFKTKFLNRRKNNIKLDDTDSIDGDSIGAFSSNSDDWDTLRFFSNYEASYKADESSTSFDSLSDSVNNEPADSVTRYVNILWENTKQDTLQQPQLVDPSDIQSAVPAVVLKSGISGDLTFTASIHLRVQINVVSNQSPDPVQSEYAWELRHTDYTGSTITNYGAVLDTSPGADDSEDYNFGIQTHAISQSISNIDAGDQFAFFLRLNADTASSTSTDADFDVDLYNDSTIDFEILKSTETVTVKHWLIHDVFERIVAGMTGNTSGFYSEFFGLQTEHGYSSDGCGGFNSITNGSQLRTIDNGLEISFNEVMSWASARYGVGWGFELDSGSYRIRVEPMEHFYSGGEIVDIGSPASIKEKQTYSEQTFDDLLINDIQIGYKDFSKDEDLENSIDDFLTLAEYQLPIKNVEGEYVQISELIASGRLIQATYEQIDLTKSWKYDDRNFVVAVEEASGNYTPENDTPFSIVEGLDDATTAYNIRHAPVYMFLEHALLVNSTLLGKDLNDVIVNTAVKVNRDFGARYTSGETCKLGDIQRLKRDADGNIEIGDNYVGYRLFNPVSNSITVFLTDTQWEDIKDAMENNHATTSKNLGYITYRDEDGNTKEGFLLDANRSPIERVATLELLEMADNYGI